MKDVDEAQEEAIAWKGLAEMQELAYIDACRWQNQMFIFMIEYDTVH